MVSLYHHDHFQVDDEIPRMNDSFRSERPFEEFDDVEASLPVLIERTFSNPIWPHFSWPQIVRRWLDRPVVYNLRYGGMHHDSIC